MNNPIERNSKAPYAVHPNTICASVKSVSDWYMFLRKHREAILFSTPEHSVLTMTELDINNDASQVDVACMSVQNIAVSLAFTPETFDVTPALDGCVEVVDARSKIIRMVAIVNT